MWRRGVSAGIRKPQEFTKKQMIANRGRLPIVSFYVALCFAAMASAQTTVHSVRYFQQVAISPNGNRVAWVESTAVEAGARDGTAIYVQDLNSPSSRPQRISAANRKVRSEYLTWAPDSKRLAFLSNADSSGQEELYVTDAGGGNLHKLTSLKGFLSDPAWSPDGKTIALLFTENADRAAGPLQPMTPETGVVESKIYEQRLTVVDVASGNVRQFSPADMYVYEYDWSPDSKSFAIIAAHGAGDSNWYVARLYTLGFAEAKLTEVYKPHWQIAHPRWSPDGRSIAFIEGLMSDEGSIGGDIFVVPASGGNAHNVTPGIAASPNGVFWTSSARILFTENIDSESGISAVELASGKISKLWSGPETLTVSFSADGENSAALRSSPAHPPEVWVGPAGTWQQLTNYNHDIHPDWGEVKSLHWTSDGMHIQGWLLYPQDYDPSRRYPMVVVVHGGPASAVRAGWPGRGLSFLSMFDLSARGYFVLYPNPRGSYGQGEEFTQGNIKDFGYGDFRDIMAGVDEVVKTLPVDNQRIGIFGWSYGGFMTMWAVTQTNRFAAAVAGAGLSNWQSYYGENDIDEWMIPYFGASVYDDPAVYAKSSPITFIKNVKTPTLVLVGDRDGEVPEPQSREFWHALKTLGVETQLVVYPGEGHLIFQPEHQRDIMERLVGWFDRYLKAGESASHS
jgi:dipeptidyl aminopeptidase/acylaminoacyl peptidase